MGRRFNERQRRLLATRSNGRCEECGEPLPHGFHADHRVPYSAGGPTTLINGRATCPDCNLAKGKSNDLKLRKWQVEALKQAIDFLTSDEGDGRFVINAAPGAGKTRLACAIAATLLEMGLITRVIVIAPRTSVVEQWAAEFEEVTGRAMRRRTKAGRSGPMDGHVCATWNAVRGLQDEFHAICEGSRTLVICDEHHHAVIKAAWGLSADSAFQMAAYRLILTGTPVRSDGGQSVWLDLGKDGKLVRPEGGMYTLTYGQAVELGYCRPVVFHRHWGHFKVTLPDGSVADFTSDAPAVLPKTDKADRVLLEGLSFHGLARARYFTDDGLTPVSNSYQMSMIEWASAKLDEVREGLPQAGGLVIAHNIKMAEYFAKVIELYEREAPLIAHSEVPSGENYIRDFRAKPKHRWLVSVNMIAEGVDIPRLRVLVYLPKAMTELAFRQAVGRVVRSCGPDDSSRAFVIMPGFSQFDEYARRIEDDMPPVLSPEVESSRLKCCRSCGEQNPLSAGECLSCGAEFPGRPQQFAKCECGFPNRLGEASCLNCGRGLLSAHEITLAEATRDGIISRGFEVSEDEVREAEALRPQMDEFIHEVSKKHQALARWLQGLPREAWPTLIRVARETDISGLGDPEPD